MESLKNEWFVRILTQYHFAVYFLRPLSKKADDFDDEDEDKKEDEDDDDVNDGRL